MSLRVHLEIDSDCLSVCTTIFKRITGLFLSQMFEVIHQWFRLNELYKIVESFFFKFQICIRNFGQKPKNIKMNSEASIWIQLQCVMYQWIRLNELYKLMESFFLNFKLVFDILAENRKILKRIVRREY